MTRSPDFPTTALGSCQCRAVASSISSLINGKGAEMSPHRTSSCQQIAWYLGALGGLALTLGFGGCVSSSVHFPSDSASSVTLDGSLYRPQGPGPFPAMVLLHTCSGVQQLELQWAAWVKARGYVALVVDSFTPRGMRSCGGGAPTYLEVGKDALGALTYLRSLPFVDGKRIGVMGWSHGGAAALSVAATSAVRESEPRGGGFRVSVAFYPSCTAFAYDTGIPVLMLLGGADDWMPPAQCVAAAEALIKRGGPTVEWTVYPGATHAFANSELRAGVMYLGHYLKYDADATADAEQRVEAFLATHLRGTR